MTSAPPWPHSTRRQTPTRPARHCWPHSSATTKKTTSRCSPSASTPSRRPPDPARVLVRAPHRTIPPTREVLAQLVRGALRGGANTAQVSRRAQAIVPDCVETSLGLLQDGITPSLAAGSDEIANFGADPVPRRWTTRRRRPSGSGSSTPTRTPARGADRHQVRHDYDHDHDHDRSRSRQQPDGADPQRWPVMGKREPV